MDRRVARTSFKRTTLLFLSLIFILAPPRITKWTTLGWGKGEMPAFHSNSHWRLFIKLRDVPGDFTIGKYHSKRFPLAVDADHLGLRFDRRQSFSLASKYSIDFAHNSIFFDAILRLLGISETSEELSVISPYSSSRGKVVRTAARSYQSSGGSIPSSHLYTTRKPSFTMISVSGKGVVGDYNHYRTIALQSTPNRAVSIITQDISSYIQSIDGGYFGKAKNGFRDGDLGENVLVDGVNFDFFQIGKRYRFAAKNGVEEDSASLSDSFLISARGSLNVGDIENVVEEVVVEITEPMEPCANLCKLPYINDPSLPSARDRVARCQYFIDALNQKDGLRGWYAKVIKGGFIRVGDSVSPMEAIV